MTKTADTDWRSLPEEERIAFVGHRAYVGGSDPETWYGIGRMQYHMLVQQGLEPGHVFVDMACGALRLGQYLIPYLGRGNYVGIDRSRTLIDAGLAEELPPGLVAMKAPSFLVNDRFDLAGAPAFDMALAQSLFTHLTLGDIALCGRGLRAGAKPGAVFLYTWFEGDPAKNPEGPSHPNLGWQYPFDTVAATLAAEGWASERLPPSDWRHPRGQRLARAVAT